MKVAFINTTASPSHAPARIMLSVAGKLGRDALVVYGRGVYEGPEGPMHFRMTGPLDFYSHALMSRIDDSEGLHSRRATLSMVKRLEAWEPDIVNLHNLHGHYLHLPTLFRALRDMGVRVVATLHDYWLLTGHCAYPGECGDCSGPCPRKGDYPASLTSRSDRNKRVKNKLLGLLGDRLILVGVSETMKDKVDTVIENGVDTEFFSPGDNPRENIILAVANRWEPRKHLEDIERLVPLIHPGERIVVAGAVPRKASGIEYVGSLSPEGLRELYRRAKAVVNPSDAETFGMVTAEAVASGTPVVVRRGNPLSAIASVADTSDPLALREVLDSLTPPQPLPPRYRLETMTSAYLDYFMSITER